MKKEEADLLNHWKCILQSYINPFDLIDNLPNIFEFGSSDYLNVFTKRNQKHEAVRCALEIIARSDCLLDDVINAIKESGSEWLAHLMNQEVADEDVEAEVEKMENLKHIKEVLTLVAPYLKSKIDTNEVSQRLKDEEVITEQEHENVQAKTREEGNSVGATVLFSHLVRKATGWLSVFVGILKQFNYDADLINSLDELTSVIYQPPIIQVDTELHTYSESAFSNDKAAPIKVTPKVRIAANFSGRNETSASPGSAAIKETRSTSLRHYQVSLAAPGCAGKNVIICAPTGSGKTRVAANIIANRFKDRLSTKPKAAFIVPTVVLAEQQCTNMKPILKSYKIRIDYLHGNTNQTLTELLRANEVAVMTSQILLNYLESSSESSVREFSILVMDECHHTMNDHPYNKIMLNYLFSKKNGVAPLPQVIGLTATTGVGKASVDGMAIGHVLTLCANLDAVGGIITVPPCEREELFQHTPTPKQESLELEEISDPFTRCLCQTIDDQFLILSKLNLKDVHDPIPNTLRKGDDQFIQWCQEYQKKAIEALKSRADVCRDVQSCIENLSKFNNALDLYLKCRAVDTLAYLEKEQPLKSDRSSAVEDELSRLWDNAAKQLRVCANDPRCRNQNLEKMAAVIKETFKDNSNSRVMINVKKRIYTRPITNWINQEKSLTAVKVHAGFLTGVGKGMDENTRALTHKAHERVLSSFRSGKVNVLVCTPDVASEGLDVINCNLVICYDYVKNEVKTIQLAGRVRQQGGKMIDFATRRVLARGRINVSRALLMEDTIGKVQDMFVSEPNKYLKELKERQEKATSAVLKNQRSSVDTMPRSSVFKALCKKCGTFICQGEDIVKLGNNYTCVDKTLSERYCARDAEDGGSELKREYLCSKCDLKWGISARIKRTAIIQLNATALAFRRLDSSTASDISAKQWSKVKIEFKEVDGDFVSERLYD